MMTNVPLLTAFVAGLVSFSSPCVLPLVPVYLAHLAGVSVGDVDRPARSRVLSNALAYVAGFSLVFILLGSALGAAGALVSTGSFVAVNRFWLVRLGGVIMVLLGLHQIGLISLPWLNRDRRLQIRGVTPGRVTSSFLVGVAFGAGWSPCVGPILGAILTMASNQGNASRAALLLTGYSAGMAVAFFLAAAAFTMAPSMLRRINQRLHLISSLSGAVMLAVGVIMLLGIYQRLFAEITRVAPWRPWEPTV